jgi:hypothetical protein
VATERQPDPQVALPTPLSPKRSTIGLHARTGVRQMLFSSRPPVSSLSAAIPYAASRRTAVPGSGTFLSRADVVPCTVATDLAKGRAWPDTEEVTGSNPVAPTTPALTSGDAAEVIPPHGRRGQEST